MCVCLCVQKSQYLRGLDPPPRPLLGDTGQDLYLKPYWSLNVGPVPHDGVFLDINVYFITTCSVLFIYGSEHVPASISHLSICTSHVYKHLCNIKTSLCSRSVLRSLTLWIISVVLTALHVDVAFVLYSVYML